jgi:hypothetical protein
MQMEAQSALVSAQPLCMRMQAQGALNGHVAYGSRGTGHVVYEGRGI